MKKLKLDLRESVAFFNLSIILLGREKKRRPGKGGVPSRHGGYFYLEQEIDQAYKQCMRFELSMGWTVTRKGCQ
ncbi:MAG: hypothetical protein NDI63_09960 [Pseudobdellovibrio sp.]|nr:hypothetical protein [Pseudobdellovibrio sp.]